MSDPKKDPRRLITSGLRVHRDVDWDYSFWRPKDWVCHDMHEQYGFIYSPGGDPRTGFYVSVADLSDDLDERVTAADLPALHEGVLEGLRSLPDCQILEEKEIAKGLAIGFEFKLTFSLDGETIKRRMWLLYNDRQQYTLYGQGASVYEYDVFGDTFGYIYSTFTFGDVRTQVGIPPTPQGEVHWAGSGEGVQTKPHAPRDHSERIAKRLAEIEAKIRGEQIPEEEEAEQ